MNENYPYGADINFDHYIFNRKYFIVAFPGVKTSLFEASAPIVLNKQVLFLNHHSRISAFDPLEQLNHELNCIMLTI